MALTLEQEKALLALLDGKRITLPELTATAQINDSDLFLINQMLADKSVTADVIKKFIAPDASLSKKGIVQLSNDINSTSDTKADTPKAIKQAYDLLNKIVENGVKSAKKQMRKTLYINNVSGSDDNDGLTVNKPLKTLRQAAHVAATGGVIDLILLTDYAFEKDENDLFFIAAM